MSGLFVFACVGLALLVGMVVGYALRGLAHSADDKVFEARLDAAIRQGKNNLSKTARVPTEPTNVWPNDYDDLTKPTGPKGEKTHEEFLRGVADLRNRGDSY